MEFTEFPKMGRLSRNIIVTEKIDGTNAQIEIITLDEMAQRNLHLSQVTATDPIAGLAMLTGSRTRYITPGADNFGFAAWAFKNAADLFTLGHGRHFGEWWGSGIQRGYGLQPQPGSSTADPRVGDRGARHDRALCAAGARR